MGALGKFIEKYRYFVFLLWGFGAFNFFYTMNIILGNPIRFSIAEMPMVSDILVETVVIVFSIVFIVITAYWLVKKRRKRR